jgi:hypothetical protein
MKCTAGEYYTECIPYKCERTLFQKYFDILVATYQQTLYKFACHAMKCTVWEYYTECIAGKCERILCTFYWRHLITYESPSIKHGVLSTAVALKDMLTVKPKINRCL